MSRLVVLGGAESGVGAAILAKVKGFDVFLSDNGKIKEEYAAMLDRWEISYEQGGHTRELILNADEVVKSPGIPKEAPLVRELAAQGTGIISEIEFAARYDNAKKICITGSNGKTTTTSLIYHLFTQAGLNVGLGGNIGKSYALQVATEKHDYYVPDHLDRYDHKMENYVAAKFRITRNLRPEDCFIFDSDDQITIEHLNKIVLKARMLPFSQEKELEQGAFVSEDKMVVRYEGDSSEMYLKDLALQGRHNIYNSMAAALAAKASGIDDKTIRESLSSFSPIEHRLEPVLNVGGVLYINDSKATNVDSAWYALECQTRPVVWIVGGKDKGNDYAPLVNLVKEKVKAIVCLGVDNKKIHDSFENIVGKENICDTASATEAAKAAAAFAREGDVVLLSPCCASFDLFKSYEDRGRQFKEAVRHL